jgi:hypothetical protein
MDNNFIAYKFIKSYYYVVLLETFIDYRPTLIIQLTSAHYCSASWHQLSQL